MHILKVALSAINQAHMILIRGKNVTQTAANVCAVGALATAALASHIMELEE